MSVLSVQNLKVSYGKVEALHGVSLEVESGQIVSVIGPNGAGKTTLLSALAGVLPGQGQVQYEGKALLGLSVEERVRRGLVLVPERRELFGSMSVADNLLLGSFARRDKRTVERDLQGIYARFPRLQERRRQLAGTLSGGEQQMLAIGRALMGAPRLLMLDEPSLGLAPLIVQDIFRIVQELRQEGVTVLLVEQNARAALHCSDWGYVLETGEVRLSGPASVLAQNPAVTSAYLGESHLAETDISAPEPSGA